MKRCLWIIGGLLVLVATVAVCLRAGLPPAKAATPAAPSESVPTQHVPAAQPQVVEDPIRGFCGNTFVTVITDDGTYAITGEDAVELTALAVNTAYDPQALCDCVPPVRVITEIGTETYGLYPSEAYIRCSKGQAALTVEQVALVEGILSRLGDEDRVE